MLCVFLKLNYLNFKIQIKTKGYSLSILGNNLNILERKFPTFYQQAFMYGSMTVVPFFIGGVLMMILALQGTGALAFIFLLIGMLAIPVLFLTRSIYKKIYYKQKRKNKNKQQFNTQTNKKQQSVQ